MTSARKPTVSKEAQSRNGTTERVTQTTIKKAKSTLQARSQAEVGSNLKIF
jgi:hypothetical protein